jgi:hypothetical protein
MTLTISNGDEHTFTDRLNSHRFHARVPDSQSHGEGSHPSGVHGDGQRVSSCELRRASARKTSPCEHGVQEVKTVLASEVAPGSMKAFSAEIGELRAPLLIIHTRDGEFHATMNRCP